MAPTTVTLLLPSVDLFKKCGISSTKKFFYHPPKLGCFKCSSKIGWNFTPFCPSTPCLPGCKRPSQGFPDALHKRHARTGLPLGVEREVTRGLKPRPTGVMLHLWRGQHVFPLKKVLFQTHSSGKSFNVGATSVDDQWCPLWYPRPSMWI